MNITKSRDTLLKVLDQLPKEKIHIRNEIMDIFKQMKSPREVIVKDESAEKQLATAKDKIEKLEKRRIELENELRRFKATAVAEVEASNYAGALDGFFCAGEYLCLSGEIDLACEIVSSGVTAYCRAFRNFAKHELMSYLFCRTCCLHKGGLAKYEDLFGTILKTAHKNSIEFDDMLPSDQLRTLLDWLEQEEE